VASPKESPKDEEPNVNNINILVLEDFDLTVGPEIKLLV